MKTIKVNYTDYNGKRTSTTISRQIAGFWGIHHGLPFKGGTGNDLEEYYKQLTQAIQKIVNQKDTGGWDKDNIEFSLLNDTEQKIIEQTIRQCEHDRRQLNLI